MLCNPTLMQLALPMAVAFPNLVLVVSLPPVSFPPPRNEVTSNTYTKGHFWLGSGDLDWELCPHFATGCPIPYELQSGSGGEGGGVPCVWWPERFPPGPWGLTLLLKLWGRAMGSLLPPPGRCWPRLRPLAVAA